MQYTSEIIKKIFTNLQDYAEKYQHKDLQNELQTKIANRLDLEYKIAIVANMSAGKSTLINALFGEEVLPAFNHATTDCATRIFSKQNKGAVIYFSDKDKIKLAYDNHQNFIAELTQYAQKDEDCTDEKYKNVERIELHYPFKDITTQNAGEMNIIFIDTPGPNATGEFAKKHKDQTRNIINDVDLAVFLFDYGQLDANLSSDEQGLWEIIKERINQDKNFEVFLVLNKIDMAFSDNAKTMSDWFYHEQKAIDKLKNAAITHGIKNPQIYPLSAYYALLRYRENKSHDDEDKLEVFEKKFKREFADAWENKMIEHLGIQAFTEAINEHIAHKPQKRWEELATLMGQLIDKESARIRGELETMRLHNESNMQNLLHQIYQSLDNEMQQLKANTTAKKDDRAETIARKTIVFLQNFVTKDLSGSEATQIAENSNQSFKLTQFHKIEITHQKGLRINHIIRYAMDDFVQEQLHKTAELPYLIELPRECLTYCDDFSKYWAVNGCLLASFIQKHLKIESNIETTENIFQVLMILKAKQLKTIQEIIDLHQDDNKKNKQQERLESLQAIQRMLLGH